MTTFKIPNIIHYTFKNNNLPKEIINVIEQNKRMCPGCEFRFYDDVACEAFIKVIKSIRINIFFNMLLFYKLTFAIK